MYYAFIATVYNPDVFNNIVFNAIILLEKLILL